MKTIYQNKLRTILEILNLLDANTDVWGGDRGFSQLVEILRGKSRRLQLILGLQETKSMPITLQKGAAENALLLEVEVLQGALFSFAEDSNNVRLMNLVKEPQWKLVKQSENEFASVAENIINLAVQNQDDLFDYDVTPEEIQDAQQLLDGFRSLIPQTQVFINERHTSTEEVPEVMREVGTLLKKRMGKQIRRYEKTSPEFVKRFKNARRIIDRGVRKKNKTDETGKA